MSEPPSAPPTANPILKLGWKMAASVAVVLILLLAVGFFLPGTWAAAANRRLAAPPERVFALLEDLERWREWTYWPEEVAFAREGPDRGPGATRRWDDPSLGAGSLTITRSEPPGLLAYRVEVDDGALVTEGTFRLQPEAGGTLVTWTEEGELGWNPLLAWAALRLGRVQTEELERGLARLEQALLGEAAVPGR